MLNQIFWSLVALSAYYGTIGVYADKEDLDADLLKCMEDLGVTEQSVMDAKKSGAYDGIDPCLFSCYFKKLGIINDKGMYDVEETIAINKEEIKDPDDLEKVNKITRDCAKVNEEKVSDGDKGCERSVILFKCYTEYGSQTS